MCVRIVVVSAYCHLTSTTESTEDTEENHTERLWSATLPERHRFMSFFSVFLTLCPLCSLWFVFLFVLIQVAPLATTAARLPPSGDPLRPAVFAAHYSDRRQKAAGGGKRDS